MQITIESEPKPAEMSLIIKGLTAYNASRANGETANYLFISVRSVRSEGESIKGGAVAASYLGWT